MLALFVPPSVTVIVVAPAAKPVGMLNCRLLTWPLLLLLVTEPVTGVPPSVTVTVELTANPAPYTVTEFPGLPWSGVRDVIAGLIVTVLPPPTEMPPAAVFSGEARGGICWPSLRLWVLLPPALLLSSPM